MLAVVVAGPDYGAVLGHEEALLDCEEVVLECVAVLEPD